MNLKLFRTFVLGSIALGLSLSAARASDLPLEEVKVGAKVKVIRAISLERSVSKDLRVVQFQRGREIVAPERVDPKEDWVQVMGTFLKTVTLPADDDYSVCEVDDSTERYIGFDVRKGDCNPRLSKKGSFWIYFNLGTHADESQPLTVRLLLQVSGLAMEWSRK